MSKTASLQVLPGVCSEHKQETKETKNSFAAKGVLPLAYIRYGIPNGTFFFLLDLLKPLVDFMGGQEYIFSSYSTQFFGF